MDTQNHYYGHSGALAHFTELARVRHINGLLQHGWTVHSPTLVHFADFAHLPPGARRLVWTHSSRGWNHAEDRVDTTPIGSPFSYLSALTAQENVEPIGAAVAFPVHDTRLVKIAHDDSTFARELAEREGASLVCLHPEDLDRPERLRVWAEHGHRVVSAGGRRDPNFLGRILHLVRGARKVVSNQLSTALIYAAAEGTEVEVYDGDLTIGALGTGTSRRTRELWPEFHGPHSIKQLQEIAHAELGQSYMREAEELKEILGWDRPTIIPALSYWAGAPLNKAGAVLGLVKRTEGARDAGSGNSPLAFLAHPLSHLPSRLPALPHRHTLLPEPLQPVP